MSHPQDFLYRCLPPARLLKPVLEHGAHAVLHGEMLELRRGGFAQERLTDRPVCHHDLVNADAPFIASAAALRATVTCIKRLSCRNGGRERDHGERVCKILGDAARLFAMLADGAHEALTYRQRDSRGDKVAIYAHIKE